MKLLNKLNGLKTYITAIVTVLTGTGIAISSMTGDNSGGTLSDGVQMILTGVSVFTLRHGISKEK
jgi:hypothetical protein